MPIAPEELHRFLTGVHPYDTLDDGDIDALVPQFVQRRLPAGTEIYHAGEPLDGLYLIHSGQVEIRDDNDVTVSLLGPRNSFGERGLTRDGWPPPRRAPSRTRCCSCCRSMPSAR